MNELYPFFVLTLVLIFLLYISKHTYIYIYFFFAREIKKLNWIEFMEIPTYVIFDLFKVPRNATHTLRRAVAV